MQVWVWKPKKIEALRRADHEAVEAESGGREGVEVAD